MVGDGSIGSPSDHIRSFQLSQRSLSACWISVSASARISADCAARMLAIARALPTSLFRAFRSPPERGVGWYFGVIRTSTIQRCRPAALGDYSNAGQHPSSSCLPVRSRQVLSSSRCATSFQIALAPYKRTASAVWISTVRSQRRHEMRSTWRWISERRRWPHLGAGRAGARVVQDRFPVFGREGLIRSRSGGPAYEPLQRPDFPFFRGRHAPARGSVGHFRIRT